MIKNKPDIEPNYDLYITSDGKIYAQRDYSQEAGFAIGTYIKLIIISMFGLLQVFIIAMKNWGQIKRAKKQLALIGA